MREQYKVLDTNILLADRYALESFRPKSGDTTNYAVISLQTLSELDKFRKETSERGKAAREVLKKIKDMKEKYGGSLYSGIKVEENYVIMGSLVFDSQRKTDITEKVKDHHDKAVLQLSQNLRDIGKDVELITTDTGAYDIADALGIPVSTWRDFEKGMPRTLDEAYKGWRFVETERKCLEKLLKTGFTNPEDIGINGLMPNEFVIFHGHQLPQTMTIYKEKQRTLRLIKDFSQEVKIPENSFKASEINILQQCYIHALRSPEINLVFAIGVAGTSKTFWATYVGVEQTFSDESAIYKTLLITHPNVPTIDSNDIGFLPGEMGEKMGPWVSSISDQIEQVAEVFEISSDLLEYIKKEKRLEILPTMYVRGRSLPKRFWIIDEAQNVTRPLLKTLITRIGNKSKVVVTGDPEQCDLKGVDAATNTIVWANEKFKDYEKSATIFFPDETWCVRSELAKEAIKRL